eukprot:g1464.t1
MYLYNGACVDECRSNYVEKQRWVFDFFGLMIGKCELPIPTYEYTVAWGSSTNGGYLPTSIASLKNIKTIFSTKDAFAALTSENSVVPWGASSYGGTVLKNVKTVFSTRYAFAALSNENSVAEFDDSGATVPRWMITMHSHVGQANLEGYSKTRAAGKYGLGLQAGRLLWVNMFLFFLACKKTWKLNMLILLLLCMQKAKAEKFSMQKTITTQAYGARSVYAVDIDGDGDIDILSASSGVQPTSESMALSSRKYDYKIAWYENTDGKGTFSSQHIIINIITTQAIGAKSVYAADVDGDGDIDVLSASENDQKIAWYENTDGKGTFNRTTQHINIYDVTYPHIIATQANIAKSVYAVDIDAWYENTDGKGTFNRTTQHIITTQANVAKSVYAVDIDGDGDIDVLSASFGDNKIAWYENTDGKGTFSSQHIITTQANWARSVYAVDIDGDGDIDVLSASENDDKIAWYENADGKGTFSSTTHHIITTQANGARSVYAADVDGDGDIDVFSASENDDKIAWYENIDCVFTNTIQAGIERMEASNVHNVILPENRSLVLNKTLSIYMMKNTVRRIYTANGIYKNKERYTVFCKQSESTCLELLTGSQFESPFHIHGIIFDSLYTHQSTVIHMKKVQGATPSLKHGNPIVFRNVKFQHIYISGKRPVILSDASPITLIDVQFVNITAPMLIELGYGEHLLKWEEPSVFASVSVICSTKANLWLPLVVQNAHKINVTSNISDIIWDELTQPVVAFLKNQSTDTSAAIIQSRNLASRKGKLFENGCSKIYPNCCERKTLEDISSAKIDAGILQYGKHVLKIKTKVDTATLAILDDLNAPSYLQPCPPGTNWQWEEGYIAKCKPIICAAGMEVKEGSSSCSPCESGYFKSIGGSHRCRSCPRNTYGSVNDTKTCINCPLNSNSPPNATSIDQCKCSGNYFKGNDQCKECPNNAKKWYDEGTFDTVCKCIENYYQSGLGNSMECKECPLNSNSPPNATSIDQCQCSGNYFKDNDQCKQCPNNAKKWYNQGSIDNVCKCQKNYYKSDLGNSMECKECPFNSNSPPNATSIDQCTCSSNYFKDNNQCKQCPNNALQVASSGAPDDVCICRENYYKSSSADAMECIKCPANSNSQKNATMIDQCTCTNGFSREASSTACVRCPVGKRSVDGICRECPKGSYQDQEGQYICIDCPKDTYAKTKFNTALSQCLKCTDHLNDAITLYSKSISKDQCICKLGFYFDGICQECPTGAKCNKANTTVERLQTESGFWRSGISQVIFHKCLLPQHCPGTNGTFEKDLQCATGHTATLCAACLKGYKMVQDACKQCDEDFAYVPWLILYLLAYLTLLAYMKCSVTRKKEIDASAMEKSADALSEMVGTGKILISFLQIFTSLQLTMTIPWADSFKGMMDFFRIITIDLSNIFASVEICSFVSDFSSGFYAYMALLPTLSMVAVLAACTLIICDMKKRTAYIRSAIKIIFTVMFLLYPSLGGKIFSVFQCISVGEMQYFVESMEMQCHTGQHAELVTIAVVFMVLYVLGIPLYILILLKNNRDKLKNKKIIELYGSLYSQYQEEYWYWEIIEMLRKVFLCGGLLTIAAGTSFQIVVALLVQFFYILLIERVMPYKHFHDDVVQLIGSIQLFLTLIAGLMLNLLKDNTTQNINSVEEENLGILLIVLNSIIFIASACSLYLATPQGKKRLYKSMTKVTPNQKIETPRKNMPRGRSLATRLVEDDRNSNVALSNKISSQRRSSQARLEKRILKRGAEKVN